MLAERVRHIEYAIRDLVVEAQKLEKQGRKILYANIGDPLKYDFAPPRAMVDALYGAIQGGHNYYSDSQGDLETRRAIAERERRLNGTKISAEDVIITTGVSESIFFLTASLIESGDEALLPGPSYPPYISYVNFFGGKPVFYRTIEEEGWQPDVADIEKRITKRTKFLLSINPNNPTGAAYDKKALKAMVELANKHNLILVADEVYDLHMYEKKFCGMASVTEGAPLVGFNGLSKSYMATGWRIGWTYFANADERLRQIREAMLRLSRIRLCAATPFQKAAIPLLRGDDKHLVNDIKRLRERRDFSYKRLNEIRGISTAKPDAAFYIFPRIDADAMKKGGWENDKEFVLDLLHTKNVLAVQGSGFGGYGENHFRIVFLPEMKSLDEIYGRIDDFMKAKVR